MAWDVPVRISFQLLQWIYIVVYVDLNIPKHVIKWMQALYLQTWEGDFILACL